MNRGTPIDDADELVSVTLARRLQFAARDSSAGVLKIPFKKHLLGIRVKGAGWWPARQPRFFRRGAVDITDENRGYLNIRNDADVVELPARKQNCMVHFNHTDVKEELARVNHYTTFEADRDDFSIRQWLVMPRLEFFSRLVLKKGYQLGWHGVILAIFQAWYRWLVAVKRWEMNRMGGREGIKDRYDQNRRKVIIEWENE